MISNSAILAMVKDITIARMENTTMPPTEEGGKNVADFMQAIYNKLVELNSESTQ